jgi:UDP-N-acetylglucosamine 2-epimerase (non-hydrolysing)
VDIIKDRYSKIPKSNENNKVPITLHRRENREHFITILKSINRFAKNNRSLRFIFPAHPNPSTQESLHVLKASNIEIIAPMGYFEFLDLLAESRFIITDSGGIQEEAVTLHKKVIVCRDTTERTEGIDVGVCMLSGHTLNKKHFDWAMRPLNVDYVNPFGEGNSSELIVKNIKENI